MDEGSILYPNIFGFILKLVQYQQGTGLCQTQTRVLTYE